MKKKSVLFLAALLACGCFACAVGCGDDSGKENTPSGGQSSQGNGSEGGSHVHEWGEWEETKSATCSAAGEEARVCRTDSSHRETRPTDIDPEAHKWDDGVKKAATCCEDGEITYTCEYNPEHTRTEVIPLEPDAHIFDGEKCTVCGTDKNFTKNLAYVFDEASDGYYVSGIGDATERDIILPCVYMGKSVTGISAKAFEGHAELKSFILSENVKEIGESAFADCWGLTSMTIPKNVTHVASLAFNDCFRLVEVVNLSSLSITDCGGIGSNALNVYLSEDFESKFKISGDFKFYNAEDGAYLIDYVGESAEVALPADFFGAAYEIFNFAFCGCGTLSRVSLPDWLEYIPDCLFYGCENLTQVAIPDGVEEIGESVFYNCSSLLVVDVPENVIHIGGFAFGGCVNLKEVTLSEGIEEIGMSAFSGCKSLQKIDLPEGITSVEDFLFSGCESLKQVSLPESLIEIGRSAFRNCKSLSEVLIPKNVGYIGLNAFENCSGLSGVTFEEPTTWTVKNETGEFTVDVSDPKKNVSYLTDEYTGYDWEI